jgi:hypothetical protein
MEVRVVHGWYGAGWYVPAGRFRCCRRSNCSRSSRRASLCHEVGDGTTRNPCRNLMSCPSTLAGDPETLPVRHATKRRHEPRCGQEPPGFLFGTPSLPVTVVALADRPWGRQRRPIRRAQLVRSGKKSPPPRRHRPSGSRTYQGHEHIARDVAFHIARQLPRGPSKQPAA